MSSFNPQQPPIAGANDRTATAFQIAVMQGRLSTAMLVKVLAVQPGDLGPTGTVTVQQMVHQVDGSGNAMPHGPTYNVPYFRAQGGANAVILDPAVDDIGLAVFAHRDISSVKATRAAALPASRRRHNPADALYVGGFLNGTPTQWVRFLTDGVQLGAGGNTLTLSSTGLVIDAPSIMHNGHEIGFTHEHGGVQPGGSNTGTVAT